MSDMQAWNALGTHVILVWVFGAASAAVLVAVRWAWDVQVARRRRTHGAGLVSGAVAADRGWEQMLRVELTHLTDVELCWAWRASFRALGESDDVSWRGRVAEVRHAYLAELERRYPAETSAWLETCPPPGDGPERFLRAGRTRGQDAA